MKTPAQQHFARAQAKAQGEKQQLLDPTATHENGQQYQLMKAALVEHRRQLSDIQSIARKIEVKAVLLPEYQSYIDGVIEADTGTENDVLMTIMIWNLDVGNIGEALRIGEYAIKHDLTAPDQYKRSASAILVEQSAEYAQAIAKEETIDGELNTLLLDQLQSIETLTESVDMHDQIRAKQYKALGYLARNCENNQQALDYLEKALKLDSKAGVKKDIQQLQSAIKKAANAE